MLMLRMSQHSRQRSILSLAMSDPILHWVRWDGVDLQPIGCWWLTILAFE
jgi:hypothetical protein